MNRVIEAFTMKKTLFYNFLGSKEDEIASVESNTPHKVSKVVVEIRDIHPPPRFDYLSPWQIRKKLTMFEVANGMLVISSSDAFDHIFRYFSLDMANDVVSGNKAPILMRDVSELGYPKTYYGANFYFKMLPDGDYALACEDIFQDHKLGMDDEIGLFVDPWRLYIVFKVLSKARG